jgi:hypothetical protein
MSGPLLQVRYAYALLSGLGGISMPFTFHFHVPRGNNNRRGIQGLACFASSGFREMVAWILFLIVTIDVKYNKSFTMNHRPYNAQFLMLFHNDCIDFI